MRRITRQTSSLLLCDRPRTVCVRLKGSGALTPCPDQPHNRLMTRLYKSMPPASLLWELFYYKPLTGELVWKKQLSIRGKVGSTAGTLTGKGACEIQINTNKYLAHRLIWVWVTEVDLSTSILDHKNRNPRDNRFWNLRVATQSQNMSNVTHTNPTGYKGVQRKGTRFTARIRIGSKVTYLGSFGTAAEAGAAYARAAVRLHGDFACLQSRPNTVV